MKNNASEWLCYTYNRTDVWMLLNVATYTAYRIPVLFTCLVPQSSVANCSKTTIIWHFEKLTPTLHKGNVFANIAKNSGVSNFTVTENWPAQKKIKSVLWPKLQHFLTKLNSNFSLHKFSRYVNCGKKINFFHDRF